MNGDAGLYSTILSDLVLWAKKLRTADPARARALINRMRYEMSTVDSRASLTIGEDHSIVAIMAGVTYEVDPDGHGYIRVKVERVQ